MTITLNDTTVELPSSLSEITIGQRIAFYEEHGRQLEEMAMAVQKTEDPTEKQLEIVNFNYEKMLRVFAFVTGISLEALNESEFLDVIATVYYSSLEDLFNDEFPKEPQASFQIKGEEWVLSEPELKNGSLMSFGEFIDAKQLVKDMIDAGKGKWETVQYLSAIYLRKKGEPYKEEFLYENSDRLKQMAELTMDIAQHVDFFLSGITNSSTVTLKYFERTVLKEVERMYVNTSKYMAGLISSSQSQPRKFSTFQGVARIVSIAQGKQSL